MNHNPDRERDLEKFVKRSGDDTAFPMGKAFKCALCGIRFGFSSQRNFKVHTVFAAIAIILGFALHIPQSSWLAVVLCISIVYALELANTAVESIVDLVSPKWHELAMHAKDCSAGAVFVAAVGSLVVAAIIYIPPIVEIAMYVSQAAGS